MSDSQKRIEKVLGEQFPRTPAPQLAYAARAVLAALTPESAVGQVLTKPQEGEQWIVQRWADEHSAKEAPIGTVLYDDDDDLFSVKIKTNAWAVYYRTTGDLHNGYIDGDRGDQIVGRLDVSSAGQVLTEGEAKP